METSSQSRKHHIFPLHEMMGAIIFLNSSKKCNITQENCYYPVPHIKDVSMTDKLADKLNLLSKKIFFHVTAYILSISIPFFRLPFM